MRCIFECEYGLSCGNVIGCKGFCVACVSWKVNIVARLTNLGCAFDNLGCAGEPVQRTLIRARTFVILCAKREEIADHTLRIWKERNISNISTTIWSLYDINSIFKDQKGVRMSSKVRG